jgi:ABC-type branched-subunit amino acid transport system ATPase component/ABC-type branched-subunit amino acid transport system permease subunit
VRSMGSGARLPLRRWSATLSSSRFPFATLGVCAVGAIAVIYGVGSGNLYWQNQLSQVAVYTIVVAGLNLSFGFGGEFSFAQVAFFGLGAYTAGYLQMHLNSDLLLTIGIVGGIGIVAAVITGFPAMRIRGWSLAMISFFVVLLFQDGLTTFVSVTGGSDGMTGIQPPSIFGIHLSADIVYGITIAGAVAAVLALRAIIRSTFGLRLAAMRESPVLARTSGISISSTKLLAYVLGSVPAAFAGILFAYTSTYLSPSTFGFSSAVQIGAASIIGGASSIYGAPLGAALLQFTVVETASLERYALLVFGVALVAGGLFFRNGIAGILRNLNGTTGLGTFGGMSRTAPPATTSTGTRAKSSLRIEGVTKSFGGVRALNDIEMTVLGGSVTALVGSNGSGKTTLLNIVSGLIDPDSGKVQLDGTELLGVPAEKRARGDLARTFQTPLLPKGLTVREAVAAGCTWSGGSQRDGGSTWTRRRKRLLLARTEEAIRVAGLGELAEREVSALSLGAQRLTELARAIAGESQIILMDEPASGLTEDDRIALASVLSSVMSLGTTVLLVEHNIDFVRSVAQRVFALDLGNVIASGTPDEVFNAASVKAAFLGEGPAEHIRVPVSDETQTPDGPADARSTGLLTISGLTGGYGKNMCVADVSLSVSEGRVLGIVGANGAGKTTLLRLVAGALQPRSGTVSLRDEEITQLPTHVRSRMGIALVEPKQVFGSLTVQENLDVAAFALRGRDRNGPGTTAAQYEMFPALADRRAMTAGLLSGGQQQMLAIACALVGEPSLLLLDEPLTGLAPAIADLILQKLLEICSTGIGVLLVEQEINRALAVADEVSIMVNGGIVETTAVASADPDHIAQVILG